jgi:hypothetical protein
LTEPSINHIENYMKTITLNVSEPVYADFQRYAREQDRPASELMREAMEAYRRANIRPSKSLRDRQPASVEAVRQPWTDREGLLGDILD